MPITKSAIKRVRQSGKRRVRNVGHKRTLRQKTKALETALDAKDTKELDELLASVYGAYDTAVKKNLIHKNKAARKKSHYANRVKSLPATKAKKSPAKKPVAKK